MDFCNRKPLSLGHECLLDLNKEVIIKDNIPISLSRIQFRLMVYLAHQMGKPVPKKELILFSWGTEAFISRNDLYVYINRLRQLIEDNPKKPKCLLSLRGVGYVLYPRQSNLNEK